MSEKLDNTPPETKEQFFSGCKKRAVSMFGKSLVKDSIWTTFFSLAGKSIGFVIPLFIAGWFGVSAETDAFFFAYGIILFLSNIFAITLERIIVPFIAETRSKEEDVGLFVGNILGFSCVILVAIACVLLFTIRPVMSFCTDFDPQAMDLIRVILLETSPLIVLLVWTSILAGTLNAYKKFTFPALSPGFRGVVNIGVIFIFKDILGVHAIALGYVLGELIRFLILFFVNYQQTLIKLRISIKATPRLKSFIKTASFQMVSMVAVGLNPVVDQAMASWLGKGAVSIMYYADRLYYIPVTFLSTGIMVTILSHWSERFYDGGVQKLHIDVKKAVKAILIISIIIALPFLLLKQQLVSIAFGHGEFAVDRLHETGWVFSCYMLGFIPYMLGRVYVQAHLTIKNTVTLMKCAIYLNVLNMAGNYIFMKYFSVAGIALSTSMAALFSYLYLRNIFNNKMKNLGYL